jgi:polysaccharide deacetylase family protein (PEP-CTERM system associated)
MSAPAKHVDATSCVNALSVDVEDYFQVSAFEQHVAQADWDSRELRVDRNVGRLLEIFAEHDVRATFFMLGWVAQKVPSMVREIVAGGHEIASHGFKHTRVTTQQPHEFREDIVRTKALLEDMSGQEVIGYRAASYSINRDNMWALDILAETGHRYSSSVYPIKHDLYGIPDAPRFRFAVGESRLTEIPITTVPLLGRNWPCGGGGYFRLFPYWMSKWALEHVNRVERQSAVFYFHPWEIDPGQPRVEGLGWKTKFRHYLNLDRVEHRLRQLLDDFHWDRLDRVFAFR